MDNQIVDKAQHSCLSLQNVAHSVLTIHFVKIETTLWSNVFIEWV